MKRKDSVDVWQTIDFGLTIDRKYIVTVNEDGMRCKCHFLQMLCISCQKDISDLGLDVSLDVVSRCFLFTVCFDPKSELYSKKSAVCHQLSTEEKTDSHPLSQREKKILAVLKGNTEGTLKEHEKGSKVSSYFAKQNRTKRLLEQF